MQVTKEEYDSIHKAREEQGFYKSSKIGLLNEDMWQFHKTHEFDMLNSISLFTTTDKEKFINNLPGQFKLYCPKGTKFFCHANGNEEIWTGPDDAFESMSAGWAKRHLTDIEPYEQD